MEMFWGRTATFWGAIEALGVCANTVFVVATLLFIYRQSGQQRSPSNLM